MPTAIGVMSEVGISRASRQRQQRSFAHYQAAGLILYFPTADFCVSRVRTHNVLMAFSMACLSDS